MACRHQLLPPQSHCTLEHISPPHHQSLLHWTVATVLTPLHPACPHCHPYACLCLIGYRLSPRLCCQRVPSISCCLLPASSRAITNSNQHLTAWMPGGTSYICQPFLLFCWCFFAWQQLSSWWVPQGRAIWTSTQSHRLSRSTQLKEHLGFPSTSDLSSCFQHHRIHRQTLFAVSCLW